MKQPEKQEHMLEYAHKKYGKDIKIRSAEGNILQFFTEDKSVTLTCHNNGTIDEAVRWRRGHKPTDKKDITTAGETGDKASPEADGHKNPKAAKRAKTEKSETEPEGIHQLTFDDILKQQEDDIRFGPEKPNPYKAGDSVELIYGSHTAYTVIGTDGNLCHVIISSNEWDSRTIAAADLRSSKKPARKIDA